MNAIFTHFSGLIGVLVFLTQVWNAAPLERGIALSACAALGMYVVLMTGQFVVSAILEYRPPVAEEVSPVDPSAEEAVTAEASPAAEAPLVTNAPEMTPA
ncbi:MAG: hypothetical protein AAGI71_15465 [Bacteroidota bacterium]